MDNTYSSYSIFYSSILYINTVSNIQCTKPVLFFDNCIIIDIKTVLNWELTSRYLQIRSIYSHCLNIFKKKHTVQCFLLFDWLIKITIIQKSIQVQKCYIIPYLKTGKEHKFRQHLLLIFDSCFVLSMLSFTSDFTCWVYSNSIKILLAFSILYLVWLIWLLSKAIFVNDNTAVYNHDISKCL